MEIKNLKYKDHLIPSRKFNSFISRLAYETTILVLNKFDMLDTFIEDLYEQKRIRTLQNFARLFMNIKNCYGGIINKNLNWFGSRNADTYRMLHIMYMIFFIAKLKKYNLITKNNGGVLLYHFVAFYLDTVSSAVELHYSTDDDIKEGIDKILDTYPSFLKNFQTTSDAQTIIEHLFKQ